LDESIGVDCSLEEEKQYMATETKLTPNVTENTSNTFWWMEWATPDVAAAKAFLGGLFGWTFNDVPLPDGSSYSFALNGGLQVGAVSSQRDDEIKMGVPPHINAYIYVDDVDASESKAAGLGATVVVPAFDVMDAGRMSVLIDPTGAAVCLWQPGEHTGAEWVKAAGGLSWTELLTNDVEGARTFYGELLGWTWDKMDGDMEYWVATSNGRQTCGLMAIRPDMQGVPPHWNVIIGIENADTAAAYIKNNGGTVTFGPIDTPFGRTVGVIDPQGVSFTIMQPNEDWG
jgi:predicted enzyme related to lactoylglutathione lyase